MAKNSKKYNRQYYLKRHGGVLKVIHLSEDEKNFIRAHSADMYTTKIAEEIGCDTGTVTYLIRKEGLPKCTAKWKKWGIGEAKRLIEMYESGKSHDAIAKEFGINPKYIHQKVYYLKKLHNLK